LKERRKVERKKGCEERRMEGRKEGRKEGEKGDLKSLTHLIPLFLLFPFSSFPICYRHLIVLTILLYFLIS
jgi:hypothetical protein